jgi:hypothetical protein
MSKAGGTIDPGDELIITVCVIEFIIIFVIKIIIAIVKIIVNTQNVSLSVVVEGSPQVAYFLLSLRRRHRQQFVAFASIIHRMCYKH